jgi:hypothetical protein
MIMYKTFFIATLFISITSQAQINHQLQPPNLEGTIKVHPSPKVNEDLLPEGQKQSVSTTTPTQKKAETPAPETPAETTAPPVEPTPAPETKNSKPSSSFVLWLIIVGLLGILLGRSFRK